MSSTGYREASGVWRRVAVLLRRAGGSLAGRLAPGRAASLQHVIESQIVPRLVIADCLPGAAGAHPDGSWDPTPDDVAEFSRLLLEHDAGVALAYVEVLFSKGASERSVWLGLLASTARHLGALSASGALDPGRVMVAQNRLREVLCAVDERRGPRCAGTALAEPSGSA
jgi:hypothetical protein